MSKSVNKVILVGNLTRDPETSYRQELAIAKLGIATNERRKDQSTGAVSYTHLTQPTTLVV